MPSLSDRLKALGVQIGSKGLEQPKLQAQYPLETVLGGREISNNFGESFVVEKTFPQNHLHGNAVLRQDGSLFTHSSWARDDRILRLSPDTIAFIDTETTGLSGGTGTYAFLIGIGRFNGDEFQLSQFFMRDPLEEPAQLYALEEFLGACEAIVSYNGKAFDIPLLNTRYLTHGWNTPFSDQPHMDLLHLARRLWRDRLPSRALSNLEYQILGFSRTEDDVPGWIIPQMYYEYLRSGDARPLKSIFYHNAMDILSLAALFNHTAGILSNPLHSKIKHGVDVIALGKLFEDLGETDKSIDLYIKGLEKELPESTLIDGIQRLARIYKRNKNFTQAIRLWQLAATRQDIESHVELAKYYEHQISDYEEAIKWTSLAISIIDSETHPIVVSRRYMQELTHRLSRLEKKLKRFQSD